MRVQDLRKTRPPKILIYGPPGTGKTGLVTQASGGYMIDTDGGMLTALNLVDKFTKYRHNIEFDTFVDDDPRYAKAWIKMKEKIFKIGRECRGGTWKYDCLCIDSLTQMGISCYRQIMSMSGGINSKPKIQHWGDMVHDMRNLLHLVTTLPIPVLVCTHEQPFEIDEGSIFMKPKTIGNKLCDEVVCMFDEVWYTQINKKPPSQGHADFEVSWIPSSARETRTRSGKLQKFSMKEYGLRDLFKEVGYEYKHEPENVL
jgi:hypothetical protein